MSDEQLVHITGSDEQRHCSSNHTGSVAEHCLVWIVLGRVLGTNQPRTCTVREGDMLLCRTVSDELNQVSFKQLC